MNLSVFVYFMVILNDLANFVQRFCAATHNEIYVYL